MKKELKKMLKIKQTDERLMLANRPPKDKMRYYKWGCFLLTLISATLWKANKTIEEDYDFIDDMMALERRLYRQGAIDEELYIKNYNEVCDYISIWFSISHRLVYVHERKKYSGFPCNYIVIGKWRHKYSHFVLMDGVGNKKNNIVYNSLSESKTIEYGTMIESRVFKFEKRS